VRVSLLWLALCSSVASAQPSSDLVGLWHAKLRFGPDVRGRLVVELQDGAWRASIAGRSVAARRRADTIAFRLPGGDFFTGLVLGRSIVGHWLQANRTGSPLTLDACGAGCYQGDVVPLGDALTFYLKVTLQPDGSLGAFLRNPERNLGGPWLPVRRIRHDGPGVTLLDRNDRAVATGILRDGVLSVPLRGGTYDFRRVADTGFSDFYPRGRPDSRYAYVPPRLRDDGWPVARLRDVGVSEAGISAAIQRLIDMPIDSVATPQTHALLLARGGKLVLEEYFFGEHADKPHDTRSASKTYVSALIGAAMHRGLRISPETRVYPTLRPDARDLPADKRAMTLEHLMTMSSGFDCNDSGERPGDEDVLIEQDSNPDWTRLILDLNVVRTPGDSAVYCSIQPHLAGQMLARAAGRSLRDLYRTLIAEPLGMRRYYLTLTPAGDVYFGGGHRLLARDFLKLAQLYLNGGTWHGRRVVARDWVMRSVVPRFRMGANMYGYVWWIREYAYRARTIKAYYAVGNGSQLSMWIPDLDLAIVAYGGNYNSTSINYLLQQFIPQVLLPAVEPAERS
jgi:CubicO group peptidase (beta-lactamase class C family)